ncbi:MAG TPA: hypothetical protein DCK95_02990 [Anaerolineaceae bacterium]|nr:hypothetical protein [Anaerolineaceae bacterium]
MPRNKEFTKDLSEGWKHLNQKWKEPYENKLEYSKAVIERTINNFENPVICWSGGKDSTALIHLVKQIESDIPIINIDVDVEFESTKFFISRLVNEWNLNFYSSSCNEYSFWDVGEKYGWPIFGKNISSNVGRAIRTGNIRPQLSEFERFLVINNANISNKCAYYLREKPSIQLEKKLNADAKFIGLRAQESRIRSVLWVDYGDCYYVKNYYGKDKGIWKLNPIALWTEEDVWRYHSENNIPMCSIYNSGYTRNGCWTCCMGIKHGQLHRLRTNFPDKFMYLVKETEMGEEITRLLVQIKKKKGEDIPKYANITNILNKTPDFFDKF